MSKKKLNHLKKLEVEFYEARDKLRDYKQKIAEAGCFHPDEYINISYKERDDGYGHFSYIRFKTCLICKDVLETTYAITKEEYENR